MPLTNIQPVDSQLPADEHIQYVSNDGLLQDIEEQLREEAAHSKRKGMPSNFYINNKELTAELCACKRTGVLSDKAIHMFQLLVKHVQRRLYYRDKDIEADVASEALCILITKWKEFDPTVTQNAFAYLTQICLNGLARGWNIQAKPGVHIPIDSLFQTNKHD